MYRVQALFAYQSGHEDDLEFLAGQIIHVTGEEDEDWLEGWFVDAQGTRKEGIFPANFVERLPEPSVPPRPSRHGSQLSSGNAQLQADTRNSGNSTKGAAANTGGVSTVSSTTQPEKVDQMRSAIDQKRSTGSETSLSHATETGVPTLSTAETLPSSTYETTASAPGEPRHDAGSRPQTVVDERRTSKESARSAAEQTSGHEPEKSALKSGSFRERIAAFNKTGDVPLAPKPMPKPSSFIKKPYIPPPPSSAAYIVNLPPKPPPIHTTHGAQSVPSPPASSSPRTADLQSDDSESSQQAQQVEYQAQYGSLQERITALKNMHLAHHPPVPKTRKHAPGPQLPDHDDKEEPKELNEPKGAGDPALNSPTPGDLPVETIFKPTDSGKYHAVEQSDEPEHLSILQSPTQEDVISFSNRRQSSSESEYEIDEETARKNALRERMAKMSGGMGMHLGLALGLNVPSQTTSSSHKKDLSKSNVQQPQAQSPTSDPDHNTMRFGFESQEGQMLIMQQVSPVEQSDLGTVRALHDLPPSSPPPFPIRSVTAEQEDEGPNHLSLSPTQNSSSSISNHSAPPYGQKSSDLQLRKASSSAQPSSKEVEDKFIGRPSIEVQPNLPVKQFEETFTTAPSHTNTLRGPAPPPPPHPPVSPISDVQKIISPSSNNTLPSSKSPPPPPPPTVVYAENEMGKNTAPQKQEKRERIDNSDEQLKRSLSSDDKSPAAETEKSSATFHHAPPSRPVPPTSLPPPPMQSPTMAPVPPFLPAPAPAPLTSREYGDVSSRQKERPSFDSASAYTEELILRSSTQQSYMAHDVDLGEQTQWWLIPNAPPPIYLNRSRNLTYEIEESNIERRSGKTNITREVYILFQDYSRSTIIAQYDKQAEPNQVKLSQKHDPPPPIPSREELEAISEQFGPQLLDLVNTVSGTTLADGTSLAFIKEMLSRVPNLLPNAGSRSFGVCIYENLANASVQTRDLIRPGDIVTFKNAKFASSGKAFHGKYSMDVGKPDHFAIVYEWDGSKRKLHVWEQGRDNRKIGRVSYKLGDLKSGEIHIYRPMPKSWIGW